MEDNALSKEHLINHIEDWKKRILDLYSNIGEWVKDDRQYSVKTTRTVRMYEEYMQKFDIEPQNLPAADILKNGKLILSVKPFGLWVTGANGRLDILSEKGSLILSDTSDRFQKPQWRIFSPKNRGKGIVFTKDYLLGLLKQK